MGYSKKSSRKIQLKLSVRRAGWWRSPAAYACVRKMSLAKSRDRRNRLRTIAVGEPTRAAMSFAEKQGIPVSKLTIVNTPKGEYLAAKQVVIGRPAAKILEETLPQVIQEISWPRSMYWTGAQGPRFIRPIRWIVALLDGKVVPFTFAGVQAGSHTDGHRFLGKKRILVQGPTDYESKLKKNFVLCRPNARHRKIEAEIRTLTTRKGLRAHEDAALLESVTYLNEYPSVIIGDFDPGLSGACPTRF